MNRVQSDRYWYDEGRKTAKMETIREIKERTLDLLQQKLGGAVKRLFVRLCTKRLLAKDTFLSVFCLRQGLYPCD